MESTLESQLKRWSEVAPQQCRAAGDGYKVKLLDWQPVTDENAQVIVQQAIQRQKMTWTLSYLLRGHYGANVDNKIYRYTSFPALSLLSAYLGVIEGDER